MTSLQVLLMPCPGEITEMRDHAVLRPPMRGRIQQDFVVPTRSIDCGGWRGSNARVPGCSWTVREAGGIAS
jgi:hypothetical protein